jgi:hypothetical protein
MPVRFAPKTPEQFAFAQVCFDFHLPVPPLLKADKQLCRTDHMQISTNPVENEPVRHSPPGGIVSETLREAHTLFPRIDGSAEQEPLVPKEFF